MKNLETGDDLEQVAIHEVAHAIVGVHYGLTLHMVDLYEQMTYFKPPNHLAWEQVQELYLAGVAAEYLAGYEIPPSKLYRSTDWATALKAYGETWIENQIVIEKEKHFLAGKWSVVEKLTALLLKQGYLDHADVKDNL